MKKPKSNQEWLENLKKAIEKIKSKNEKKTTVRKSRKKKEESAE